MSQTVAEILINCLQQIGVKQVFGLIGDSLNPIADALSHTSIEWIGVRHEEGAALAAAGQAKLTGRLGVCAGTTGPGSTHLVAGLYEAARDHAPVLAISGDMLSKFQGNDYIQTSTPDLLFRDVSLYTQTISNAESAPNIIHQAIANAYAGKGVAHLTVPQDVLVAKAPHRVISVETLKPNNDFSPSGECMVKVIEKIDDADKIIILCGAGCLGIGNDLIALSERLHAPLIHTVKGQDILAYDHPNWMGGIGLIGTKPDYNAMMNCDLLIMLGCDYPYSDYLAQKASVIQIDERPSVLGRRVQTELGIVGSVRPALKILLDHLKQKQNQNFFRLLSNERKKWNAHLDKQSSLERSKTLIYPQALARMVSDLAEPDAVFVLDTGLNTLWSANWIRQSGKQRIIGSFNNAAVGTSLGQANGIQALDRTRQVIVLCGDGGFNMLMGELLTAVHHKLPVKIIIYNNAAFTLITLEAESVGLVPYKKGIEFTNPDYETLARACGAKGFTANHPSELKAAICAAFAAEGPAIVDARVVADEAPNLMRLDISIIGKVGLSKIKQAIQYVTETRKK